MTKTPYLLTCLLIISVLILSACGGDEEAPADAPEAEPTSAPAAAAPTEPAPVPETSELMAYQFPGGAELVSFEEGGLQRNPVITATESGFRWGALVKRGNEVSWVVNGESTSIGTGDITDFAASADLSRHAYVANDVVAVDGNQVDQGSTSCCPTFSDDGSIVVVNGTAGQSHGDGVDNLVVSPDGSRSAYIVGGNTVVLDGEEQTQYESVSTLTFSPDGSRFAYIANDALLVLDDEESDIGETTAELIVFSPDSSRLAYVQDELRLGKLFVDEKEQTRYTFGCAPSLLPWRCITFTSDSESVAYTTLILSSGAGVIGGTTALQFRLVQDGERQREAVGCCLVASPTGAHVAHVAHVSKGFTILVDGQQVESEAAGLTDATLVFSYVIRLDLPGGLVPADLVFSTDGETLAFLLYEAAVSTQAASITNLYLEELEVP